MIEWLQACCAQDPTRTHMRSPFPAEAFGRRGAAATDGTLMLLVEGVEVPPTDVKPPPVDRLGYAFPSDLTVVSLDSLREWARCEVPGLVQKPCSVCNGTRQFRCTHCDGHGRVDCECDCGHWHEADCEECGGEPTGECEECDDGTEIVLPGPEPGRVLGVAVDRRKVWRVVQHATGAEVGIAASGELDPVWLVGDGWFAIVMPMRESPEWGSDRCFP